MRYFFFVFLLSIALACGNEGLPDTTPASATSPAPAAAPENPPAKPYDPATDFTLVAGQRAGAMDKTTTVADVIRIYGKENVRQITEDMGSGAEATAYAILPGTPNELTFVPKDNQYGNQFIIRTPGGAWAFAQTDLRVGTPLDRVRELNGAPFFIASNSTEAAGDVADWNGGRLTGTDLTFAGFRTLRGIRQNDQMEVSSDEPGVTNARLQVTTINVFTEFE